MSFLKIISVLILGFNSYIGLRFLLNVFHVLQTSKYSKTATLIYAIIFLCLAVVGFYFLLSVKKVKLSFRIATVPWIFFLLFQLLNMLFGDYK